MVRLETNNSLDGDRDWNGPLRVTEREGCYSHFATALCHLTSHHTPDLHRVMHFDRCFWDFCTDRTSSLAVALVGKLSGFKKLETLREATPLDPLGVPTPR